MSEKLQQAVINAQQGDRSALAVIYSETFIPTFFMLSEAFNNTDTAFMLTKRAYTNAFRHISQASGSLRFETLLKSAAIHECKLLIASQNTGHIEGIDEIEHESIAPSIPKIFIQDKQLRTLVLRKIRELPDDQRICVLLTYYGGVSVNTLSETLGCTPNEAELTLSNANKKISSEIKHLSEDGFGDLQNPGGDEALTLMLRLCAKDCKIDIARYNALFADISKGLDNDNNDIKSISIAEIKYRDSAPAVRRENPKPSADTDSADTKAIPITRTAPRDTVSVEKVDYIPSEPYETAQRSSSAPLIVLVVALALLTLSVLGFAAYKYGLLPIGKNNTTETSADTTASDTTQATSTETTTEITTETTTAETTTEAATTTTTTTASTTATKPPVTTTKPVTTTRVSGPTKLGSVTANPGADHVLNLRSGPNTSNSVISTISHGTKLDFYEYSSDKKWIKVNYNGTYGWVSLDYVTLS
ncbi:MAG: SH3 domain-containing protein [Clostridiales bacterium]|nr:SH3 domain-containing protein [Clostridiales bacterium]